MAYNKTTWVDNTTPIDSTNLNKIEQGIYENSLVADAVNSTVKPSESALTSATEIIEGQMTNVLAISNIEIKGNTVQDGTPTPSAPVDINVVSGSNVISTCNENLFPLKLNIDGTPILQQRCNVIIQKDEIVFTATGDDSYFGDVTSTGTAYSKTVGVLLTIPSGATEIYLKLSNNSFNHNFITFYDESKTSLGYIKIVNSIEIPANAKYFSIRLGIDHPTVGTTYRFKVIVSTSNKEYIPHQGKELPLDLPVENLFNKNAVNETSGFLDANGAIVANATFKVSDYIDISSITDLTISGNSGRGENIAFYDSNKDFLSSINMVTSNSKTVSIPNNAKYLRTTVKNDNLNIYQVEKGLKANTYTPYGTTLIELCKIGDYQDYFYKDGNDWYLHKEVGKVVLDGTENLGKHEQSGFYRYALYGYSINDISLANDIITYSSHFKGITFNNRHSDTNNTIYTVSNGLSNNEIYFNVTNIETLADFKAWLANNLPSVYYILKTATDTEITDTTLKAQLEAIYNAPLYEQTNITQENNDLPMVLDITAYKDNINGIKAWIRK